MATALHNDVVLDQLLDVSQRLECPEILTLPLYRDPSPGAPRAYTNNDGIWVRGDVVDDYPEWIGGLIAHEIFHHVVQQPDQTFGFKFRIVAQAEDYHINTWIHDLFGYDLRKLPKGGALYSRTASKMSLPKLCEYITVHKVPGQGCGCLGLAHPTILRVASRLRDRFNINTESNRQLIQHELADEEEYLKVLPMIRDRVRLDNIPVDLNRLAKALWMKVYLRKPIPTNLHEHLLDSEQAIVYGWQCYAVRQSSIGNAEVAATAVITYLRKLNSHPRILSLAWNRSVHRVEDLEAQIVDLNTDLQDVLDRPRKSKKIRDLIAKKEKRLGTARISSAKAELKMREPLPVLLIKHPVKHKGIPALIKHNSLTKASAHVVHEWDGDLSAMPRLKSNKTVRALAWLSALGERQLESLLRLHEAMGESLEDVVNNTPEDGDIVEQPEPREPTPPAGPPPQFDDEEIPDDPEEGIDDPDDDDQEIAPPPDDPRPQHGSGKQKGTPTAWTQMVDMDETDVDFLVEVMQHMQYFETMLRAKPRANIDPEATSLDLMPSIGNLLQKADASEFALLNDPATALLFYAKLANGGLSISEPRQKKRQAVVITLDCSGSMKGSRYAMACGFGLAMVKMLQHEKRGWGLQLFSGTVVGEMYWSGQGEGPSLAQVIKMLLTPFFGGTDFYNAIDGMFQLRTEQNWKETSFLMVTDAEAGVQDIERVALKDRKLPGEYLTVITVTEAVIRSLMGLVDATYVVKKADLGITLAKVGNELL